MVLSLNLVQKSFNGFTNNYFNNVSDFMFDLIFNELLMALGVLSGNLAKPVIIYLD